jgi:hypothetical protein
MAVRQIITWIGAAVVTALTISSIPVQAAPSSKKILIVVLENADYDAAKKQKFLGWLSRNGAVLTNCYAQTHPSQPNYIAMVAGDTYGVDDLPNGDVKVTRDARHLGDLLEAKGLEWKVYAEGYPGKPGKCFLRGSAGNYARKHVPFLSFRDVQSDPARCNRIVNASQFDADIQTGLPAFALYVPDLKNDGHIPPSPGVAFADGWLGKKFQKLLSDPAFTKDLLFVVTFDEGSGGGKHVKSHILTVLFGNAVAAGAASAQPYTHYSLLKLVEDTFGLGNLGKNDASAERIQGIWK